MVFKAKNEEINVNEEYTRGDSDLVGAKGEHEVSSLSELDGHRDRREWKLLELVNRGLTRVVRAALTPLSLENASCVCAPKGARAGALLRLHMLCWHFAQLIEGACLLLVAFRSASLIATLRLRLRLQSGRTCSIRVRVLVREQIYSASSDERRSCITIVIELSVRVHGLCY